MKAIILTQRKTAIKFLATVFFLAVFAQYVSLTGARAQTMVTAGDGRQAQETQSDPVRMHTVDQLTNSIKRNQQEISVDPESNEYGEVIVDERASCTFTVTNVADSGTLSVTSIKIAGNNADEFEIETEDTEFELEPDETQDINVNFNPTSTGDKTATLQFYYNSNVNPFEVELTGTGVAPVIKVNPVSKDYGEVEVGKSTPETFEVENAGDATLNVDEIYLDGADKVQFNIDSGGDGFTLEPGFNNIHSVVVSFKPTSRGRKTAQLKFNSNDPDKESYTVGLGGKGIGPGIIVTPRPHDYGPVLVDSSKSQRFTVKNRGETELEIDSVYLYGANIDQFKIESGGGKFTLKQNESLYVVVSFNPTKIDTQKAQLKFKSNDPAYKNSDYRVYLEGEGVVPDIDVYPGKGDYQPVDVGKSQTIQFDVKNNDKGTLFVKMVSITGNDSLQFKITQDGNAFNLEQNETHTVEVSFIPTKTGPITAYLTFESNDPDSGILNVELKGEGIKANMVLNPAELNFGNVKVQTDSLLSLTILNNGNADLRISSITEPSDSTDFRLGQVPSLPVTLSKGDSVVIQVFFKPEREGSQSDWLEITSNVTTGRVRLSGAGVSFLQGLILSFINYPNPFNLNDQVTRISYVLAQEATLSMNIYDTSGDLITELNKSGQKSWRGKSGLIAWDGTNFNNQKMANGVYICELIVKTDDGKEERRYRKIAIFSGNNN